MVMLVDKRCMAAGATDAKPGDPSLAGLCWHCCSRCGQGSSCRGGAVFDAEALFARAAVFDLKRADAAYPALYYFPKKKHTSDSCSKEEDDFVKFEMWWLPHDILNVIFHRGMCCDATPVAVPHGVGHPRWRLVRLSLRRQESLSDRTRAERVESSM